MSRIFLSYRRDDTREIVGRIYDHLSSYFGRKKIFKDVDSIPYGKDFRKIIKSAVNSSGVMLVVIGENWLGDTTDKFINKLSNPDDFVRLEIEYAIKKGIPIFPVLVSGASLPKKEYLPESLQELIFQNTIKVRPDPDFISDTKKMIFSLEKLGVKKKKNYKPLIIPSIITILLLMAYSYYNWFFVNKLSDINLSSKEFVKNFYLNAPRTFIDHSYDQLSSNTKKEFNKQIFKKFWTQSVLDVDILDIEKSDRDQFDITLFYKKN